MPITAAEAAAVAKRHGLTLADAAGLASLANDVADADDIASKFAGTDTDTEAARFAAELFGRADEPETDPDDTPTFAARLFGATDT